MFEDFSISVQHNMQIAMFKACESLPLHDSRRVKTAESIIKAARQGITSAEGLTAVAKRSTFRIVHGSLT